MALDLTLRQATVADLPVIVQMLAEDELGQEREHYQEPLPDNYYKLSV